MLRIPGKLWIIGFFLTTPLLFAQNRGAVRPNYKQAELFNPDYLRQRTYSTSVSPQWIGETDRFWYSYKTSQGTNYSIVDPAKRKKEPLFDHQDLASKLSIELRKPVDEFALSFSNPKVDDQGAMFSFVMEKLSFELDLKTGVLTNKGEPKPNARNQRTARMQGQLRRRGGTPPPEQDEEEKKDPRAHRNFSPDRTAYVFLQDYDLYYVEASDEVKKEIKAIEEKLKKEKEEKKKAKAEGETKEKVEGEEKKEEKELKVEVDVEDEKVVEEEKDDEKKDVEEKKDTEKKKDVEEEEKDDVEKEDGDEQKKDDDGDEKKHKKDDDGEKEKEEDKVDERERWADDIDETKALRLTDDCEEKFEFSGGGRFSRRRSELEEEDANQYGWDENDVYERARLLGLDDEVAPRQDGETKQDEVKKERRRRGGERRNDRRDDVKKDDGEKDDVKEEDVKKDDEKKKDDDQVEEKKDGEGEDEKKKDEKDEPKKTRPGVSWAPDSSAFYATRRDSRGIAELFLVNSLSEPRPTLETYSYPMPGEENVSKSELFIFDRTRKEFFVVPPVWKDEGYTNVHWGKLPEREPIERDDDEEDAELPKDAPTDKWKETGAELRFLRRDRLLRNIQLVSMNVRTSEAKTLIEDGFEKGNVDYQSVRYLKDRKDEMVWWSERTGWGHYYLYQWDGTLKNAVTSGAFRASSVIEIDEEKGLLYFRANAREEGENVYYEHLYRVYLDGTDLSLMDPGNSTHRSTLSPTNNYVVDNHSRVDLAPQSVLRDADGEEIMKLEESDLSRLYEAGWKMPETFTVKAADGVTDLFGNMWKPFDFDPKKRYPIIAEVYPGPQTEGVSSSFSASNSRQQLAQVGFIVVQLGHRGGTPARSKAYHIYGYFDLRDYGLADKKAGLEQLAARHRFIDIERVGIYGHSGGGFMTGAALLRKPYNEFFKVGIASAGNHDNNIYNQWWSERYHGLKRVEVEVKKKEEKTGRRSRNGEKKDVDLKKDDDEKKDVDLKKDDDEKKDVELKKDDDEEKDVDLKEDDDEKKDVELKEDDGDKKDVELKKDDGDKKDVDLKEDDGEKKDVELKEDDDEKKDVELKEDDDEKKDVDLKKDDDEKKDVDLKEDDGEKEDVELKKDGDKKKEEEKKETEVRFEIHIPTNAELAANLKGHLLLVHGEIDNNVHPAGTIRLADALIKANKRFDMMILPGQRHGFGAYSNYFNRMRWEYFAEHLLGDYQTGADINYRE